MTAAEVLDQVLLAGGRVIANPARPRLVVPPALKSLVIEHRAALRVLVLAGMTAPPAVAPPPGPDPATVGRLLAMPLDVFAREGQPVELRVPWWSATLFLVPDVRHAEALWREGIARERVWTAAEVASLLPAAPAPAQWRLLTVTKRELGGDVVEVRPRAREEARG